MHGYVELMKHKKELHPSNTKCRNFESGKCRFGIKCWYIHEDQSMNTDETKKPKFECHLCDNAFNTIDDLKKHGKRTHPNYVKICEKFLAGTCVRNSDSCWYKHEAEHAVRNEEDEYQAQAVPWQWMDQQTARLLGQY